jgi:pimeloyl-ACP methyl ester carboxylesterase
VTGRRTVVKALSLLVFADPFDALAQRTNRTYVIVHGAWGGGWDWRTVSDVLTGRGHVVLRPTLTGLGERAHLTSPNIDLSTHIADVVNVLLYENLRDVTLVGHSYGGMVITGVADRVPDRISHLAYVDAFVPEDGESLMSILTPQLAEQFQSATQDGFIVPAWVRAGSNPPANVPQPARTFTEPITLKNQLRARIPTTYILTVERGASTDDFDRFAERAKTKGWKIDRLTADHNAQRSARQELCVLLEQTR